MDPLGLGQRHQRLHGIPMLKVPKLSVRNLQQLVAIGAAMAC